MGGIPVSQLLNFAFNVGRIFRKEDADLDKGMSCLNIKVFPS